MGVVRLRFDTTVHYRFQRYRPLGGLYLAYELLGGKYGALRLLSRLLTYHQHDYLDAGDLYLLRSETAAEMI